MKTVLIVDDEKNIRIDLKKNLRRNGCLVFLAPTVEEAEEIIKNETLDYAIFDLNLDRKSEYAGIQLYLFAKHHKPKTNIFILSAYPFQGVVKKEFEREFNKRFGKTSESAKLLSEVEKNYVSKGGTKNYIKAILEKLEKVKQEKPFGSYHALLFAVQDYTHAQIQNLKNPLEDARSLQKVLSNGYDFNHNSIDFVKNPDRMTILEKLSGMSCRLNTNDNLLIFFAGHGKWEPKIQQGYWLPKNAHPKNRSEWISNSDIRDHLKMIDTQHTLLISDACFSGAIFRGRGGEREEDASFDTIYKKRSRKAMTSCAMQTTPDGSFFFKSILNQLEGNTENHLSAFQLFNEISMYVPKKAQTIPEYNMIADIDEDEGGHFIFNRK